MGLRTWLGSKERREPPLPHRYPDVSPNAASTAHILPERPAFTDFLHRRINGREQHTPWMSKPRMISFAQEHGFGVPKTFAVLSKAADLDFSRYPERFVVKPSDLWSTKGVMLLQKRRADDYFEMMHQRLVSAAAIRRAQASFQRLTIRHRPKSKPTIVVEEMVEDEFGQDLIPFDYKFYAFNGEVKFIVQVDRNSTPPKIAFYRGDFEPIPFDGEWIRPELQRAQRGRHRIPNCCKEQIEVARILSREMKTPFISVDTYASAEGPVVGEITPTPGGSYYGMWRFHESFDLELGDAWAKAERDLLVSGGSAP